MPWPRVSACMYNCLFIRDLQRQIINSLLHLACTKLHQKWQRKQYYSIICIKHMVRTQWVYNMFRPCILATVRLCINLSRNYTKCVWGVPQSYDRGKALVGQTNTFSRVPKNLKRPFSWNFLGPQRGKLACLDQPFSIFERVNQLSLSYSYFAPPNWWIIP
jgi:hypothetical protein